MQGQPTNQNISNPQQGSQSNLQPNRSDLQPYEGTSNQPAPALDQQAIPLQSEGRLQVDSTDTTTQYNTSSGSLPSGDLSITPFAVTAGVVLVLLVVLAILAVRFTAKTAPVSTDTVPEIPPEPVANSPKKPKKKSRRQRKSDR